MDEPVETLDYKGCKIEIYQDDNAESPSQWGDNAVFLVGYHRDFTVEAPNFGNQKGSMFNKHELQAFFEGDKEGYSFSFKDYHIFGLEAYIHGDVALHLSGGCTIDRQWDVSQIGAVLISKKETRYKARALRMARCLIGEWNQYLSGEIYGFKALDEQGNELDSCWGFYGNYEKSGLVSDAKGNIDYYLEQKKAILHDIVVTA